jgi:hypothetical protein
MTDLVARLLTPKLSSDSRLGIVDLARRERR